MLKMSDVTSSEGVTIPTGVTDDGFEGITASTSLTYAEMIVALSPLRYYRHGEPSGTAMVDQISAKNGLYTGVFTLDTTSLLASGDDSSIDLTGNTTAEIPQDSDFNVGTGDFTWMFLVKTNGVQDDKFIIDLRQGDGTGYHVTTGGSGGTLSGGLRYAVGGGLNLGSSVVIDDSSTHHCVIKRTSGSVTLWVDGILKGTGSDTTSYTRATGNISYAHSSFGGAGFDAVMDELPYFDFAVSDEDILALATKALGL